MNIINLDYDPKYKLIILNSDYFRLWLLDQLPHWETINDIEDFLHLIGIDVEDTIEMVINENIKSLRVIDP